MKEFRTYKFYNNKKQRLTIVGQCENEKIKIITIPCNRKDQFCKKKGYDIYQEILKGKEFIHNSYEISGEDARDFIRHCHSMYFIKEGIVIRTDKELIFSVRKPKKKLSGNPSVIIEYLK